MIPKSTLSIHSNNVNQMLNNKCNSLEICSICGAFQFQNMLLHCTCLTVCQFDISSMIYRRVRQFCLEVLSEWCRLSGVYSFCLDTYNLSIQALIFEHFTAPLPAASLLFFPLRFLIHMLVLLGLIPEGLYFCQGTKFVSSPFICF